VGSICTRRERDSFEGQASSAAIERYQMYRIKYYKILETTHLVREEVMRIEAEMPPRYFDLLNNVKRFLKVIEINHHQECSVQGVGIAKYQERN
jgi:hypothetical protein